MTNEVRAAAERAIDQWDNHDRHRVTEADQPHLIDGAPPEIHWARHYLETTAMLSRQTVLDAPYGEMSVGGKTYPNGTLITDGKLGGFPVPSHWQRRTDQEGAK